MTPATIENTLLAVSAFAEFVVAWVIYYEWEGGRLDDFLADADRSVEDRHTIYETFCSLPQAGAKARSQAFKDFVELHGDKKLLDACHTNIRLLSRIGSRLPLIPWLKRTPLDWHVAALLWMILGPYVEGRRDEAGPTYADNFLRYALASTDHLLAQKRDTWTIRDPDRTRMQDVTFSRAEMKAMRIELKASLKRKG